jgi:hypothetical protein
VTASICSTHMAKLASPAPQTACLRCQPCCCYSRAAAAAAKDAYRSACFDIVTNCCSTHSTTHAIEEHCPILHNQTLLLLLLLLSLIARCAYVSSPTAATRSAPEHHPTPPILQAGTFGGTNQAAHAISPGLRSRPHSAAVAAAAAADCPVRRQAHLVITARLHLR